jgi:hypothetical protein
MVDEVVANVGKIRVVVTEWEGAEYPKEMAFEWTEPSNYCVFPDAEYSHTLTREEASILLAALRDFCDT